MTEHTGTGLDVVLDLIAKDPGLARRISDADRDAGADAAAGMNALIVEGVRALGLADDRDLTRSDVIALNEWLRDDDARLARFTALHGDDDRGVETGFHRVRGDGATSRLYDRNAIDVVFDDIYHIGFALEDGRFLNENGDPATPIGAATRWLQNLLAEDVASGALASGTAPEFARTGTGLDASIDIIMSDPGYDWRMSELDRRDAAADAAGINAMMVEGIRDYGLVDDGDFTVGDLRALNAWFRETPDRIARFEALRGEGETDPGGFALADELGSQTTLFNGCAIGYVFDMVYRVGYALENDKFQGPGGDESINVRLVHTWLEWLLLDDIASGELASGEAPTPEATGSGLDLVLDIIAEDPALARNVSALDLRGGADAAAGLNALLLEGIAAYGLADDRDFTMSDVLALNAWFREDAARYQRFVALHGDDEDGLETGFHLVQGDGATTRLYGRNAIDVVFDGVYHIGFAIEDGRFVNEDGDPNATVANLADWIGDLLDDEIGSGALASGAAPAFQTTGTGLDRAVDIVMTDRVIDWRMSELDRREGAEAAAGINAMIAEGVRALGLAGDGVIDTGDLRTLNGWIRGDDDRFDRFVFLRGEGAQETAGWDLVNEAGADARLFGRDALGYVFDHVYMVGCDIENERFVSPDGDESTNIRFVANWLDRLWFDDVA